jgi:protein-tyrosine phosphatase
LALSAGSRDALSGRTAALYAAVRQRVEALFHPFRHRRVAESLRRTPRPRSILVVCHGNVCRSPYLAAVLTKLLPDVDVSSAGFVTPGRPVPEHSAAISASKGLDLSKHRSRLLTRDLVWRADLIVVMDARQASQVAMALGGRATNVIVAGDLDPAPGLARTIHDPWRQGREIFQSTFARLDRVATVLARTLPFGPNSRR